MSPGWAGRFLSTVQPGKSPSLSWECPSLLTSSCLLALSPSILLQAGVTIHFLTHSSSHTAWSPHCLRVMPGSPGRVGEGLPVAPSLSFWPYLQARCLSLPLPLPPSVSVCGLCISVCLSLTHSPQLRLHHPAVPRAWLFSSFGPCVMLTPQPESPSSSTQGTRMPPQGTQPSPHIFPAPLHPRSGAEFTTPSPVHPQNWSVFHTGSRGSCLQPLLWACGSPSCPDIWLQPGAHQPSFPQPGPASASTPRPISSCPHKAAGPSYGKVRRSASPCLTALCSLTGISPSLSVPLPVFSTRQGTPLIHSLRCAHPSPSLEMTSPVRTEFPASPIAPERSPPGLPSLLFTTSCFLPLHEVPGGQEAHLTSLCSPEVLCT